jgi:SAM-dependent methyltransferase
MEGWEGWDDYAPFYDWENARTLGRRDVPFWQRLAQQAMTKGRSTCVLELGCGTGRVTFPLWRAGISSSDHRWQRCWRAVQAPPDGHAAIARACKDPLIDGRSHLHFIRGDIRHLPFPDGTFPVVIAPYGAVALARARSRGDTDAVARRAAGVRPRALADLGVLVNIATSRSARPAPQRRHEADRIGPPGRAQTHAFDQEFVERHGRHVRRRQFTLSFRTLTVRQMRRRLEKAGFQITALLGDYQGGPWDERADAWIILATKI